MSIKDENMERATKVIVSGLENAGKTSILTALDKKYDFREEILELKPTIKVEYLITNFLGRQTMLWDMGGQEMYRNLYLARPDVYFDETDLILYVIDIQDQEKFDASLNYFDSIMKYFLRNRIELPVIVTFHKYDPEIRSYEEVNKDIMRLKGIIEERYPSFNILFQQTSIYDIISIVQLISYGLSVFDNKFFELSLLLETTLNEFDCHSLILFDENGIIVSEFYSENIDSEIYIPLLESIKEHLFLLERIQEENYKDQESYLTVENQLVSYLHQVDIKHIKFYISVLIKEEFQEHFMEGFSSFLGKLKEILHSLVP